MGYDKKNLSVNENVFFTVDGGEITAWNYETRQKFIISLAGFKCLINPKDSPTNTVDTLHAKGLLIARSRLKGKSWRWDIFSKIFHFGTMLRRQEVKSSDAIQESQAYLNYCAMIMPSMPSDAFMTTRGSGGIALRKIKPPSRLTSFLRLLEDRRTNRTFTGQTLQWSSISLILDEAFKYREHDLRAYDSKGIWTPTKRRSSPSAGALQTCEAYLIARNVGEIQSGIYHYRSHLQNLGRIQDLPEDFSFGELLGGQMFADDLSAVIVITGRFDKLMWKYKQSRSYRVALFDAGHLSQTTQLLATGLGVRTWPTAAFYDDELSELLLLTNEHNEYPLLVIGLGTGPNNPFDRDID
ncbi:MAG: SagB/ThcOx family dehydrogenase [Alcaligenaceae bacterium]|nr:MAG: SagB/ThcOx family dehydrogenase [Alcaligenaceae bacterium]